VGLTDPGPTWDDLVVPEDTRSALRAIARRARGRASSGREPARPRRRPGIGPFLFVGAAGTGKTLATQIIAAAAGLPLHECDLGPALAGQRRDLERVVAEAFDAAQSNGAIAVIDGAAPLVRRPSSADGPGADWRTDDVLSHLVERASRFDGVVIVTATMSRGIDPGLTEHFAGVVEFPAPQVEARVEIWRRSLPADAELPDGTLHYLASWLTWTGGTIHSCCVAAAQEAATEGVPLQLRHVRRMLDQGYRTSARSHATDAEPPPRPASPGRQRRPASPGPPARPSSFGPPARTPAAAGRDGRRWPVIAGGMAIAAALVGLVVALAAGAQSGSPPNARARVGAVEVSLPSGWRREAPSDQAPFGLTSALTIASPPPARGVLILGQLAGDSSPLPRTVLAALSPQTAPEVVRLGPVVLYQYRTPSSGGATGGERVYVMPTTTGTIVAVCRPRAQSPTFTTTCGRVLATLRLRSGRALPVGLSSAYASALSTVINQLNTVRSSAGRQLATAGTAQAQAAAALKLAQAHAQAAAAVAKLNAGQAASANAALAHALTMTADGYRALALAASHRNLSAYRTARSALASAAQTQGSAFQQLRALGYRLA
jgi:hypothetical protein